MKVYTRLEELPPLRNTVVTIGSFDGVHSGHQKILTEVVQLARKNAVPAVVITFHPHPRHVLNPSDTSVSLLTTVAEKTAQMASKGIDILVFVPFTPEFAALSADDYLAHFLVKYFQPTHIIIGYDHHFGAKRAGNIEYLRQLSSKFGYEVVEIDKIIVNEIDVSSTKIRQALLEGDVRTANHLLGYPYTFHGRVVEGQKIGREIGFPTANLEIEEVHKLLPPHGIYAVFVYIDGQKYKGMMYRGNRPVLKDHHNITLEINIFDFNQNIYGKEMKVELIHFLRPDQYFESLENLVVQLAEDERESREILQVVENEAFPRVAIVILNYNGEKYLQQFLPSVCETGYGHLQIFVADNASTDHSIEVIQKLNLEGIPALSGLDRVRVIRLETNHGFAKGYNEALKHPHLAPKNARNPYGFDYYVLLNSDVKVVSKWLDPIIEVMEADPLVAAAMPKIISYTKKRKFEYAGAAGGWIDTLCYPFSRGRVFQEVEKDKKQYDDVAEIFWASGAAMVVRADLYHRFDGFDADYWAHMEEIDLCWRFKRAGYKVMAVTHSSVRHLGGGTLDYLNPRKSYLNFRNSLATLLKNEPVSKLLWALPVRLVLDGVAGVMFLSKGQFKHIGMIVKAHWHFFARVPQIWRKRQQYDALIEQERVAVDNRVGILRGSIVWAFYVRGKKTFDAILGR